MTKIPYQRLRATGEVLIAARGANIHTFSLCDGVHLSTWEHPSARGIGSVSPPEVGTDPAALAALEAAEASPGPPMKKMRLDDGREGSGAGIEDGDGKAKAKAKEQKKGGGPNHGLKSPETPMVIILEVTSDGRHVVAVTGQDKTVWVLEHDGKGSLKLLSQRMMPKRPCSIAITPDDRTIISADKFGDVYSLPLIPADPPAARQVDDEQQQQQQPSLAPEESRTFRPQANELTVHTQRNLKALESQKKHRQAAAAQPKTAPAFEHTLLLGHVSMLTAVALAPHPQRPDRYYILTADRDEHIRVSRGIPQAHVIEAFCLGHRGFVSQICIPPRWRGLLVSGGGDRDLFAWDWASGRLLYRTDLLVHVQNVVPGADKVAVSGLFSFGTDTAQGDCWVLVLAERIPALFCFELSSGGVLELAQIIKLEGNPLDLATSDFTSSPGQIFIVSIDSNRSNIEGAPPGEQTRGSLENVADLACLVTFELDAATKRWQPQKVLSFHDEDLHDTQREVGEEDLSKLLYPTENLRKADNEEAAEA